MTIDLCRVSIGCSLLLALGTLAAPPARAQRERRVIPERTVVRLRLDQRVNSRTARDGDPVFATLDVDDRSGFPLGTRFEGTVTVARHASDRQPAELDMEFRRAQLPGGDHVPITGELTSLAADAVRTTPSGRLISRRSDADFNWKWIGVGAADRPVLAHVVDNDFVEGGLQGGLGGTLYTHLNRERGGYRELNLDPGTPFGIRLDRDVMWEGRPDAGTAVSRAGDARVLGNRAEFRPGPVAVRLNGEAVRFGAATPIEIGGTLYLPLSEVASALHWGYRHDPGSDQFTLFAPGPDLHGEAGEATVTQGGTTYTLAAAPMRINGEIYIPLEYLSRVGSLTVSWDRTGRRLDLERDRSIQTNATPRPDERRLDAGALFDGLALVDTTAVRASLNDYHTARAEDAIGAQDLHVLETRIAQNSLARRNRDLLTSLLRRSQMITGTERVVGVRGHTIYVE